MLFLTTMPDALIDITFLIVNYDSTDHTLRLIQEIKSSAYRSYEVIISNNDTELFRVDDPTVRVIENGANIGFGAAHNAGANEARGKILCIINPDIYSLSQYFDDCIHTFDDPGVGIVAPRICDASGDDQRWSYSMSDITPLSLLWGNLLALMPDFKAPKSDIDPHRNLAWVTGAAFFIPTPIFLDIDGFDEKFFLYYEDIDLCRRVRSAGYTISRDTDHSLCHISGASTKDTERQKEAYFNSQDYYFQKFYGSRVASSLHFLRRLFHIQ